MVHFVRSTSRWRQTSAPKSENLRVPLTSWEERKQRARANRHRPLPQAPLETESVLGGGVWAEGSWRRRFHWHIVKNRLQVVSIGVVAQCCIVGGIIWSLRRSGASEFDDAIAHYTHLQKYPYEAERLQYFADRAHNIDEELDETEGKVGLTQWRVAHFAKARGDVLEICCGTARNLAGLERAGPYLKSLTVVDKVPELLKHARRKLAEDFSPGQLSRRYRHEGSGRVQETAGVGAGGATEQFRGSSGHEEDLPAEIPIRIDVGDAHALPYPDESFDTVLMTRSLCSVEYPLLALHEANRVLKPSGRILMIEHGAGHQYFRFFRYFMRMKDDQLSRLGFLIAEIITHGDRGYHYHNFIPSWKHGTYDTRDIPRLLEQVRLPIVSCQTYAKRTWYVLTIGKGKGLPGILWEEMRRRCAAGELGGPSGCLELTPDGQLALCELSDRTVRGEDGKPIVGAFAGGEIGIECDGTNATPTR